MRAPRIRARLDTCPRCDAAIIVALDAAIAALPVRADPVPLDAAAELAARLEGRGTYNLVGSIHAGHALVDRIPELIVHRTHPVVATHRCPGPVPATAIPAPPPPPVPGGIDPDLFAAPDDIPF